MMLTITIAAILLATVVEYDSAGPVDIDALILAAAAMEAAASSWKPYQ